MARLGTHLAGATLAAFCFLFPTAAWTAQAGGEELRPPPPAAVEAVREFPVYVPRQEVEGVIRLWGHGSHKRNFMGKLIARWAAEFSKHQPRVTLENRMYGTASAVGALYTGAGDIALLGEEISPAALQAFRRARGYDPTEILVATGSLDVNYFDYAHMIFVHRDNPIESLSLRQLDGIFGAEHRRGGENLRTWGQLGLKGDWIDQPIQPYGWQVDVDFALFFRERVMLDSHRWNPRVAEYVHLRPADGPQYDHGQRILDALAADPAGIAISNVRYAVAGVKVLALSWEADGPPVTASDATLMDQSYPLVRLIPAIVDRPPGIPLAAHIREFLRYVLSREGQTALIEETGYLPLGQTVLQQQREKLE